MRPIQLILVPLLVMGVLIYLNRVRSRVVNRLLVLCLVVLGVVMVLFPDLSQVVARFLGVGRGSDMIFYFSIVTFGYIGMLLYLKLRDMELRLTELTRKIAIENAHLPEARKAKDGRPRDDSGSTTVEDEAKAVPGDVRKNGEEFH